MVIPAICCAACSRRSSAFDIWIRRNQGTSVHHLTGPLVCPNTLSQDRTGQWTGSHCHFSLALLARKHWWIAECAQRHQRGQICEALQSLQDVTRAVPAADSHRCMFQIQAYHTAKHNLHWTALLIPLAAVCFSVIALRFLGCQYLQVGMMSADFCGKTSRMRTDPLEDSSNLFWIFHHL